MTYVRYRSTNKPGRLYNVFHWMPRFSFIQLYCETCKKHYPQHWETANCETLYETTGTYQYSLNCDTMLIFYLCINRSNLVSFVFIRNYYTFKWRNASKATVKKFTQCDQSKKFIFAYPWAINLHKIMQNLSTFHCTTVTNPPCRWLLHMIQNILGLRTRCIHMVLGHGQRLPQWLIE